MVALNLSTVLYANWLGFTRTKDKDHLFINHHGKLSQKVTMVPSSCKLAKMIASFYRSPTVTRKWMDR